MARCHRWQAPGRRWPVHLGGFPIRMKGGHTHVEGIKRDLIGVVGAENVLDDAATLKSYSRDESFVLPLKPRLVCRPGSEDEVQAVIAWANEAGTPLVPVSSGPPHFYGDTVPGVPGAVIVDMRRLNKIRRIDRRNRIVVIEPGVTYGKLGPALAEYGMRVTPPLFPRANKSVVASLLERQPTLIPRCNYSMPEPLRNCGVIWGDGTRFFTGEAGWGPADLEGQWAGGSRQVDPKGPAQTDFYRLLTGAQGTLGIVTWASVKCELLADPKKTLFVPADRLEQLVDLSYRLTRLRVGDELFIVNNSCLAALLGADAADIAALTESVPPWILIARVGGRAIMAAERMAVAEKDIAAEVAARGLRLQSAIPAVATTRVDAAVDGLAEEPHWKFRHKGSVRDIFFLTTLDKVPAFVGSVVDTAEAHKYPAGDIGVYLQPQHQGMAYHCEFSLPFDPTDAGEKAKMRGLFAAASEQLIGEGAYFSRPYPDWADKVYNRDAASREALRVVKKILDPNNILNPSKLCF